jgi:hypothetical protein
MGNQTVILLLGAATIFVVVIAFLQISKTLEKHAELALRDGTEIVSLRKAEMAAKSASQLPSGRAIPDPTAPVIDLRAIPEDDET